MPDLQRFRLRTEVVIRRFADEAVLLNLETGQYHGFDQAATTFLDALEAHESVDRACDALSAALGVDRERVADDMRAFCAELEERNLIERDDAGR